MVDLKDILARFRDRGVPEDEEIYEIVGREVESGERRTGLWTKALAEAGWDENAAKARYVEYRVAQVKEEVAAKNSEQRIGSDRPPQEVEEYLGLPIRADKYSSKYGVSRSRLDNAIAHKRIRAFKDGETLWVEDKRLK